MDLSRAFAFTVAGMCVIGGGIVIAGLFIPGYVPARFRITVGIVLVLIGIYRFSVTQFKDLQGRAPHA